MLTSGSQEETEGPVDIGLLMPLLNQLAMSPSPVVERYVSSFLTNLAMRGILTPEQLFQFVFRQGNGKLRASLAGYFMECWPGVSPAVLSTFLAHCEVDNDAEVLKRLGGVFAYHFETAPEAVVEYLDRSLKPVDTFARALAFALEQSPLRVGRRKEYSSEIAFLLTFGTLSALANFHSKVHMSQMRAFVRSKYPWLLDIILNRPNRIRVQDEAFKLGLYRRLEREGIAQWDQVIGAQGNDTFFVEEDGIVQRDELYNYYKYLVATHNGDWEQLDLSPRSAFRQAAVAMLTFKARKRNWLYCNREHGHATGPRSRPARGDRPRTNRIRARSRSPFRRFAVGGHFLHGSDASRAAPWNCSYSKIVPKAIAGEYPFDRAILDCLGIAAIDLATNWQICEPAIRHVLDQVGDATDETTLSHLGDELAKVSYFDDIGTGRNVIDLLLRENYLNDPHWRPCVMTILAGMQMRNPSLLRSILERHGEDDRTLKEVRVFASDELRDYCNKFFYMVSWNRLIAKAILDNATLRYFLIKILMGGLAQSNSVTEYTREFRRFVIEIVRAYWGESQDQERYYKLTVEEAFSETLVKRRVGGGKLWVPKYTRAA